MGALLLVRHGQASWDAEDYDVLSPRGWEQCRTLGRAWAAAGVRPSVVVRGSLRRHRESTEALLEGLGGAGVPVEVDTGWDEFDHLDLLEHLPSPPEVAPVGAEERQRVLEQSIDAWLAAPPGAPYAESHAHFHARAVAAFERTHELPGTVAVLSSGGVIGAITAHLLTAGDLSLARQVWPRLNVVGVNSGVTRVVIGRRGATLVGFNEHAHLDGTDLLSYR